MHSILTDNEDNLDGNDIDAAPYGFLRKGISQPIPAATNCPSTMGSGVHSSSVGGHAIFSQICRKSYSLAHTSAI